MCSAKPHISYSLLALSSMQISLLALLFSLLFFSSPFSSVGRIKERVHATHLHNSRTQHLETEASLLTRGWAKYISLSFAVHGCVSGVHTYAIACPPSPSCFYPSTLPTSVFLFLLHRERTPAGLDRLHPSLLLKQGPDAFHHRLPLLWRRANIHPPFPRLLRMHQLGRPK